MGARFPPGESRHRRWGVSALGALGPAVVVDDGPGPLLADAADAGVGPVPARAVVAELGRAGKVIYTRSSRRLDVARARGGQAALMWAQYATATPPSRSQSANIDSLSGQPRGDHEEPDDADARWPCGPKMRVLAENAEWASRCGSTARDDPIANRREWRVIDHPEDEQVATPGTHRCSRAAAPVQALDFALAISLATRLLTCTPSPSVSSAFSAANRGAPGLGVGTLDVFQQQVVLLRARADFTPKRHS